MKTPLLLLALAALVGALCGLGLNLVRLVAVEATLRVNVPFGRTLHDLALYAIVLPAALLAAWFWRNAPRTVRLTLAGCALYLGVFLLAGNIPPPQPPPNPNADFSAFFLDLARRGAAGAPGAERSAP